MDATMVLERKILVWKTVNDVIYLTVENGKLLLNETVKIIWELVDGIRNIQDIVDELMKIYGAEMSVNEIEDIVNETVCIMFEYDIVRVKQEDEFDGWLQYE